MMNLTALPLAGIKGTYTSKEREGCREGKGRRGRGMQERRGEGKRVRGETPMCIFKLSLEQPICCV